jgi:hypothetical protein
VAGLKVEVIITLNPGLFHSKQGKSITLIAGTDRGGDLA